MNFIQAAWNQNYQWKAEISTVIRFSGASEWSYKKKIVVLASRTQRARME